MSVVRASDERLKENKGDDTLARMQRDDEEEEVHSSAFIVSATPAAGDVQRPSLAQAATTDSATVKAKNVDNSVTVSMATNVDMYFKAAHMLHYASISILGVFVMQVLIKLVAMGTAFFRQKMEIFDAVIVVTSFVLDLVFVEGMTESEGEQAAAIIMLFLLWRILRIVNGIMVTTTNRHEFRIRLQKRARLRLEKRVDTMRDDLNWHTKHTASLSTLCREKGATEEELTVCKPRRRTVVQMTTTSGLSSIASLSLGLSLSMSVSGSAAKDRLMDNALQSSMSSSQASPMSGSGGIPGRSRRSSSLISQTATQTQAPQSAVTSTALPPGVASRCTSTGSGGVRPAMRRQSAVSESSADATSMGALSPVVEQTSTVIIE